MRAYYRVRIRHTHITAADTTLLVLIIMHFARVSDTASNGQIFFNCLNGFRSWPFVCGLTELAEFLIIGDEMLHHQA
jgi:hypothetical protein